MSPLGTDPLILRRALELAGIGCWEFDLDTERLHGVEGSLQWLGHGAKFPVDDADALLSLIHPEDQHHVVNWFQAAFGGDPTLEGVEYRLKTGSGRWRWVQSRAMVLDSSETGTHRKAVITSRDITQQKLLQAALQEAEARWTSLVDEAPIGISIIGASGQIQFANKVESAGHTVPIIGRQWKDFLPQELHPGVHSALLSALSDRIAVPIETYRVGPSGELAYFDNRVSPLMVANNTEAAMVVSLDVTREHLSRRKQRKAARRNEILLSLHDGPFIDRDSSYRVAVLAIKELVDAEDVWLFQVSNDARASTLRATTVPFDNLASVETYSETVTESWRSQQWSLEKTDDYRLVLPAELKGLVPVVVIATNRTRAFSADDCLETLEFLNQLAQLIQRKEQAVTLERLSLAIDCAPVSIVVVDQRGDVDYANRFFREHSNGVLARGTNVNFWALFGEHLSLELSHGIRAGMEQDMAWQGEISLTLEGPGVSTQFVTVTPVRRDLVGSSHFIIVMEDITQRKLTQELIYEAQKMETVGQIAAGVAHDFNNLMTSILAYNEMILRRSEQAESVRGYAERIRQAGGKASKLVSGLLAAGRRQILTKERINLGDFLKGEATLLESLAKPYFRLEKGPPSVFVEVDPVQMGQVILNLVSNAKDALEARGGEIVLSYGTAPFIDGMKAWIKVKDDGPGIPLEIQQRVFEPFFTTKKLGKGTGLGLAMAHGIVQQHGGRLALDSSAEEGTTFTIVLPLEQNLSSL